MWEGTNASICTTGNVGISSSYNGTRYKHKQEKRNTSKPRRKNVMVIERLGDLYRSSVFQVVSYDMNVPTHQGRALSQKTGMMPERSID
jgi:hypothetical protein